MTSVGRIKMLLVEPAGAGSCNEGGDAADVALGRPVPLFLFAVFLSKSRRLLRAASSLATQPTTLPAHRLLRHLCRRILPYVSPFRQSSSPAPNLTETRLSSI